MQKLIMITGEAWTGKSTYADLLYQTFENSAWLDEDDVWRVYPFSVKDKRLRNGDLNMAFVLNNYLESNFEYVFFTSIVLCDEAIRNNILDLITYKDYKAVFITLHAQKDVLKVRAKARDENLEPEFRFLENSFLNQSEFVDTSCGNAEEILNELKMIIEKI